MTDPLDTAGFSHIDFAALLRGDYNYLSGPGQKTLLEMVTLKLMINREKITVEEAKKRFPDLANEQISKVFQAK